MAWQRGEDSDEAEGAAQLLAELIIRQLGKLKAEAEQKR